MNDLSDHDVAKGRCPRSADGVIRANFLRMRILALTLAGTAAMVSGCTSMTWHKNGVPQTGMYEDADACGRIAQRYALQYASGAGLGFARVQPYRDHRYGSGIWFDRQSDRQMTETQVKQACMREKGYTLAPAEP